GMWGMGDHFVPIGAHELMMQVPLIFRHPGRIPASTTSDIIVSNYDFMTTLLHYLGLGDEIPAEPKSPGRDFSPVLRGDEMAWKNVMYYEMENTRAVRTERWKYVARFPDGPFQLYDMEEDPQERFNLFGQPGMTAIKDQLAMQLNRFFSTYANPEYNVWEGG